MWFGEFCSCCCLPHLPQLAISIPPTTYKDFFQALYIAYLLQRPSMSLCHAVDITIVLSPHMNTKEIIGFLNEADEA